MLTPAVRTPLRDAMIYCFKGLTVLVRAYLDENMDVITSPYKPGDERVDDLLDWTVQRGYERLNQLLMGLDATFGNHEDMRTAIVNCRAHLAANGTASPLEARRVLGRVFANREDLRAYFLHTFPAPQHPYRVTVVNGEPQSGKSYLWYYIKHAAESMLVDAVLIDLETDVDVLSDLVDVIVAQAPQVVPMNRFEDRNATSVRRAKTVVNKLVEWRTQNKRTSNGRPLWIVIDHLDKVWPPPEESGVMQFIEHLVLKIAQRQAEGIQLILLGVPPAAIGGRLANDLEQHVVDSLTTGDLTEWLRDELGDLGFPPEDLDREAHTVLGGGLHGLHRRLDEKCQQLRTTHGRLA
jgi:hypothetical protein